MSSFLGVLTIFFQNGKSFPHKSGLNKGGAMAQINAFEAIFSRNWSTATGKLLQPLKVHTGCKEKICMHSYFAIYVDEIKN